MPALLAALKWDPQLRGTLIVLTGAAILVGSVWLLLSTNTGVRMGTLLTVAGLSGWLFLLNVIWLMAPLGNGPIGYKGVAAGWKKLEVVQGDLVTHSGVRAITGTPGNPDTQFPSPKAGWVRLQTGNAQLSSVSPVADALLTTAPNGQQATFTSTSDYVGLGGYSKGGRNYLVNLFGYKVYWRIRAHYIFLKHQPHYVVIRVQPALSPITLQGKATGSYAGGAGSATLPAPDPTKPITSVVLLKNEGSLRLPPFLLGSASLILFLLTCERLHHRDKEIERRKAEEDAGSGRGTPRRELQPA